MKVTVEMIDAGARAIYAHEPFTWGDDSHVYETIATADRAQLRAIAAVAIEAALAVAPDPATDSDPRSCATCNGTGSLWNGGVESGRCPTCDGKGHDPAPGDAEFEACGLCGDPPPPNGKRVASKPLPPTPGPFNPFGKQDGE